MKEVAVALDAFSCLCGSRLIHQSLLATRKIVSTTPFIRIPFPSFHVNPRLFSVRLLNGLCNGFRVQRVKCA